MDNWLYILIRTWPWIFLWAGAGLGLGWWLWGRHQEARTRAGGGDSERLEGELKKKTKHWEARLKKAEEDAKRLSGDLQQYKSDNGRLKKDVQKFRAKADDAIAERDGYQSRIDMLQGQLSQGGEAQSRLEQLEKGIDKIKHERDLLRQKQEPLQLAAKERDELKLQLAEVEPKLGLLANMGGDSGVDLSARVVDLEAQLAEAQAAGAGAGDAAAKIAMLEDKLREAEASAPDADRLVNLEGQLAEANERIRAAGSFEADLKAATDRADKLETERILLENKLKGIEDQKVDFKKMSDLEEQVSNAAKEKEDATFALNQRVGILEQELEEARSASPAAPAGDDPRIGELQAQLAAANEKAAAAESAASSAGDADGKIAELEAQLAAANEKAAAAESAASSAGDADGKIADLEAQLAAANEKAATAESAASSAGDAGGKIAELEGQLAAANQRATAAEADAGNAEEAHAKIADLQRQLATAQAGSSRIDSLTSERDNLQTELASITPKLAKISGLESDKSGLETRVSDLEAQLAAARANADGAPSPAELAALRRQIAELEEKLKNELGADHPAFGEPHKAAASVDYGAVIEEEFAGEDVRSEEDWGILYNGEPGGKDDLTKIKGVGPVLSDKLNKAEVYRYKQIANWSDHNVSKFAERLESFPDRIERDRWIPQAKVLAGEAAASEPNLADFAGESVKTDATLGVLYTEKPDTVDDLTRIKGVGPVIEKKLHEFGVYRFKQIANWGAPTTAAFAEKLATFPDRIERDNWISQAKTFAAEG